MLRSWPLDIVAVEWTDTTNIAAWTDLEDIPDFATDGAYECINVGYLVYEDDACLVLAGRVTLNKDPQVGLYERIPKAVIKNVHLIGKGFRHA